jgi:glycosyltransferase involved in cell wall biosynthesis
VVYKAPWHEKQALWAISSVEGGKKGYLMETPDAEVVPSTSRPARMATIVIRSYKRIPHMLQIVDVSLKQDYPNFEVLIIEQSEQQRKDFTRELAEIKQDERVRLLEYGALGPAGARNEAVRQSRGEVLVFIDDDDLPLGTQWLANHMKNFEDDLCIAASGRQVWSEDEDPTSQDTKKNRALCLRYTFFKMPRARVRHTTRVKGITAVHGTNSSIRKSAIDRVGGWDEEKDHEEDSFAFKFERQRKPGEYFVFDPRPVILRQLDLPGGVGRREADAAYNLEAELNFSHRVIRRYYPRRFYAFYPVYIFLAFKYAANHLKKFHPESSLMSHLLALLRKSIPVWFGVIRKLNARP